jgi:hypothetical protein
MSSSVRMWLPVLCDLLPRNALLWQAELLMYLMSMKLLTRMLLLCAAICQALLACCAVCG